MALSKTKKDEVISEISSLLDEAKLTVIAKYQGTPVKAMQELRRNAKDSGTVIKVAKNRLVIRAIKSNIKFKSTDTEQFNGMLMYAFNKDDEVFPAQVLHKFAKQQGTIEFVGGLAEDGSYLTADDVKSLAELPSKETLKGMLVGTLSAPLSGFVNVLAGNNRGILNVLSARAEALK